jgi:hypothetical protein
MHIERFPVTVPQIFPDVPPHSRASRGPEGGVVVKTRASGEYRRTVGGDDGGLQGEVISRRDVQYQSTQAFLFERAMGRARFPGETDGTIPRAAIASRYLDHVQPESYAELTQGRKVDVVI